MCCDHMPFYIQQMMNNNYKVRCAIRSVCPHNRKFAKLLSVCSQSGCFDVDRKINYTINRVEENLPQSRDKLKLKRNQLYVRLQREGVIV